MASRVGSYSDKSLLEVVKDKNEVSEDYVKSSHIGKPQAKIVAPDGVMDCVTMPNPYAGIINYKCELYEDDQGLTKLSSRTGSSYSFQDSHHVAVDKSEVSG